MTAPACASVGKLCSTTGILNFYAMKTQQHSSGLNSMVHKECKSQNRAPRCMVVNTCPEKGRSKQAIRFSRKSMLQFTFPQHE